MSSFIEEKNDIIDEFISGLKSINKQLRDISLLLKSDTISAAKNPLEIRVEAAIASYDATEYQFKTNLVALYRKYHRPHPLSLNAIIENKEQELRTFLKKIKKEADDIYADILNSPHRLTPELLKEYLDWSLGLDFDVLGNRYKDFAKNPNAEGAFEDQLNSRLLKAIGKVVASWEE